MSETVKLADRTSIVWSHCTAETSEHAGKRGAENEAGANKTHLEDLLGVVLKDMQRLLQIPHVMQRHLHGLAAQPFSCMIDRTSILKATQRHLGLRFETLGSHRLIGRPGGQHVLIEGVETQAVDLCSVRLHRLHNPCTPAKDSSQNAQRLTVLHWAPASLITIATSTGLAFSPGFWQV